MNRNNDAIDIMKFILSILVIALHVRPLQGGYEAVLAICRIAVPLFFITSGYLFFAKIKGIEPSKQKRKLISFVKRGLLLYAAWFVILLPITIYTREWYKQQVVDVLKRFPISLLFGSTFRASWYLMALVIGTIIIALLGRRFSNGFLLGIGGITYLICCAYSGYGNLLPTDSFLGLRSIFNSFPVSLIWLIIGKCIAEGDRWTVRIRGKGVWLRLLVSIIAYAIEYWLCVRNRWAKETDAMIMLVPLCTIAFLLVLRADVHIGFMALRLRAVSTVSYCLHVSLSIVLSALLKYLLKFTYQSSAQCFVLFLLCALICITVGLFIYELSNKDRLKWLKWFY